MTIIKQSALMTGFLLLLSAATCRAELVVIGHPSIEAGTLNKSRILNLWLGRINKLPNGEEPRIVDQAIGAPARNSFYSKVCKKTAKQLKAYWAKKSFTRTGSPPAIVAGDAAVLEWVKSNPGGLGYVERSSVNGSVKIIMSVDG